MSRNAPARGGRSLAAIFAIPALLAVVSAVGLVAALLTDGPMDILWSLLIAAPLIAIGRALVRR